MPECPKIFSAKLNADAVKAIHSPEVNGAMSKVGYEVIADSPAEFGAFIKEETDRWVEVISSVSGR